MAFVAPEGTELVEHLGSGTMFDVAIVREGAALRVAKRLTTRMRREVKGLAAIDREARFLRLAKHPAIPSLRRAGADGEGPFVIEARVAGASLLEIGRGLRSARAGALPAPLVQRVACATSRALAELHELADANGSLACVHGDLALDHVFVDASQAVGFVDFGAARFRGLEASAGDDDRGTLPFVAPEVARRESATDQANDTYALAAVIVAFASGAPLLGATAEAAALLEVGERGVRRELAERCEGLGARARETLRAALAFDRASRLISSRELASALTEG